MRPRQPPLPWWMWPIKRIPAPLPGWSTWHNLRVHGLLPSLEDGERWVLLRVAAKAKWPIVQQVASVGLTDRRLVYTRTRWRRWRLVPLEQVMRLGEIADVQVGSRWYSLLTGLWGAATLVVCKTDGRQLRLSVYGARHFKEAIERLKREAAADP